VSSGAGSGSLELAPLVSALLSSLVSPVAISMLVAGSLEVAPVEGAAEVGALDVSATAELVASTSELASLEGAKDDMPTTDATVASDDTPGSLVPPSVPMPAGDVEQPTTSPNPSIRVLITPG
jgi:hypothetical protein